MSRSRFAVALSLLFAASPALAQDTWNIDKGHSEVGFQIRHFVTKVRGRFTDFTGQIVADAAKPENSSVEFTIKATSIDTDSENRDKDLRSANFFDVEKFPDIIFKSSKVKAAGKDKYDVTGTLQMHGVSREVTLPVTYLGSVATKDRQGRDGAKAGFETSVTISRKDFDITWNRPAETATGGVMLGDEVLVQINLECNKAMPPAPAPAAPKGN